MSHCGVYLSDSTFNKPEPTRCRRRVERPCTVAPEGALDASGRQLLYIRPRHGLIHCIITASTRTFAARRWRRLTACYSTRCCMYTVLVYVVRSDTLVGERLETVSSEGGCGGSYVCGVGVMSGGVPRSLFLGSWTGARSPRGRRWSACGTPSTERWRETRQALCTWRGRLFAEPPFARL